MILLHATWRSTGDLHLVEEHLKTAERCLDWIDNCGDRDGDGFQEYQTRSRVGYENQGWKDSGDAIVYPDGTLVKGPKALCELQGYVYDAWLRMAELYDVVGHADRAKMLREKAAELFACFNEKFWNGTKAFTHSRSTAIRSRFYRSRPTQVIAYGRASSRPSAPAVSSSG